MARAFSILSLTLLALLSTFSCNVYTSALPVFPVTTHLPSTPSIPALISRTPNISAVQHTIQVNSPPAQEQKLCGLPLLWLYPCTWTSEPSVSRLQKLGPAIFIKYIANIPETLLDSIFAPFTAIRGRSYSKNKDKRRQHAQNAGPRVETQRNEDTSAEIITEEKSLKRAGLPLFKEHISSSPPSLRAPRIFSLPALINNLALHSKPVHSSPSPFDIDIRRKAHVNAGVHVHAGAKQKRQSLKNCPLKKMPKPGFVWVWCPSMCVWQPLICLDLGARTMGSVGWVGDGGAESIGVRNGTPGTNATVGYTGLRRTEMTSVIDGGEIRTSRSTNMRSLDIAGKGGKGMKPQTDTFRPDPNLFQVKRAPLYIQNSGFSLLAPRIFAAPVLVFRAISFIPLPSATQALAAVALNHDLIDAKTAKRDLVCKGGGNEPFHDCQESSSSSLRVPRVLALPVMLFKAVKAIPLYRPTTINKHQYRRIRSTPLELENLNGTTAIQEQKTAKALCWWFVWGYYCSDKPQKPDMPTAYELCRADEPSKSDKKQTYTCGYYAVPSAAHTSRSIPRIFTIPVLAAKTVSATSKGLITKLHTFTKSKRGNDTLERRKKCSDNERQNLGCEVSCPSSSISLSPPRIFRLPLLILSLTPKRIPRCGSPSFSVLAATPPKCR
ncbi:hypothetical protein DL98DRAFT_583347 [Cadophora sp. DSE1049]|nr:hypothetical protein DL98DRAFT_583347 [Cadophora sp. DSE1049]